MSLWFRMYSDVINDPKVMRLPEAMRWHWVAVLCCASKNGGRVPAVSDVAFMLRMDEERAAAVLGGLQAAGLLDADPEGLAPHNWGARQFKSDTSNDRVKRFREKQRNGAVTECGNATGDGECNVTAAVTGTPPEQNRAEADTETGSRSDAGASRPAREPSRFDEFWKAYPRRDGPNPRKPAEAKFAALVKAGVDQQAVINAARKLGADEAARGNIGTRFIPQAMTWLNQQRWNDHAAVAAAPPSAADEAAQLEDAVRMFARSGRWSRWAGPEPGMTGCRASAELLARHGLSAEGQKLSGASAAAAA
ncbi:hypothetical protein ACQR1I_16625 [Bradyrhizobium sp. HKCCYLS2038]|uniref:hypothetical protein n=1 Tax=unclassified Bradyrhizobium TaxID=2631580 RepID=UPI003EB73C95